MRISELAEHVGVPTSTVRYYERVGLLGAPGRTGSGYRDYDDDDAARLLFVTRARHLGLTCDEVLDLLPVWDGSNCAAAQTRVEELVEAKQQELRRRIKELRAFGAELERVKAVLRSTPPPSSCRTDLSCCVPGPTAPVPVELGRPRA